MAGHDPDGGQPILVLPSLALLAAIIWMVGQVHTRGAWLSVLGSLLLVTVVVFGVREDFQAYPAVNAPSWPHQVAQFERLPPGARYTFQLRRVPDGG